MAISLVTAKLFFNRQMIKETGASIPWDAIQQQKGMKTDTYGNLDACSENCVEWKKKASPQRLHYCMIPFTEPSWNGGGGGGQISGFQGLKKRWG